MGNLSESRKILSKKGGEKLGYWMGVSEKTLYWMEEGRSFRERTLRKEANQQWKVRKSNFIFENVNRKLESWV